MKTHLLSLGLLSIASACSSSKAAPEPPPAAGSSPVAAPPPASDGPPIRAEWLGTRGKAAVGPGQCFNAEFTNHSAKVITTIYVAIYPYDESDKEIGETFAYDTVKPPGGLAAGQTLVACVGDSDNYKGVTKAIDAFAYTAKFPDNSRWFVKLPQIKAKGAPVTEPGQWR